MSFWYKIQYVIYLCFSKCNFMFSYVINSSQAIKCNHVQPKWSNESQTPCLINLQCQKVKKINSISAKVQREKWTFESGWFKLKFQIHYAIKPFKTPQSNSLFPFSHYMFPVKEKFQILWAFWVKIHWLCVFTQRCCTFAR